MVDNKTGKTNAPSDQDCGALEARDEAVKEIISCRHAATS